MCGRSQFQIDNKNFKTKRPTAHRIVCAQHTPLSMRPSIHSRVYWAVCAQHSFIVLNQRCRHTFPTMVQRKYCAMPPVCFFRTFEQCSLTLSALLAFIASAYVSLAIFCFLCKRIAIKLNTYLERFIQNEWCSRFHRPTKHCSSASIPQCMLYTANRHIQVIDEMKLGEPTVI